MRKLIESHQQDLIVCDNVSCNFKIKNETGDINAETKQYINAPCPQCGENLLTEKDYNDFEKVRRAVNWLNKWFSWLMFFVPRNAKQHKGQVKVHEGIKFKQDK